MSDYASCLRLLLALLFSSEMDQMKQIHRTCVLQRNTEQIAECLSQDKIAPPSKLLPLRHASTQPDTLLRRLWHDTQNLCNQNPQLRFMIDMADKLMPRLQEIESLHVGILLLVFKMLCYWPFPFTSLSVWKVLQICFLLAVFFAQMKSLDSTHINYKLSAALLLLLLSEQQTLAEMTQQTSSNKNDVMLINFNLNDLVFYFGMLAAIMSTDLIQFAYRSHEEADRDSQAVINTLASAIFDDEEKDFTFLSPGYAVLQVDKDNQIGLLRFNLRLARLVGADESQIERDNIANRLIDDLQSIESDANAIDGRKSFRCILLDRLMTWKKKEAAADNVKNNPKLFCYSFRYGQDGGSQLGTRSILKQSSTSRESLIISAQLLSRGELPLILIKAQRKIQKAQSSIVQQEEPRRVRSPVKRVSFDRLGKIKPIDNRSKSYDDLCKAVISEQQEVNISHVNTSEQASPNSLTSMKDCASAVVLGSMCSASEEISNFTSVTDITQPVFASSNSFIILQETQTASQPSLVSQSTPKFKKRIKNSSIQGESDKIVESSEASKESIGPPAIEIQQIQLKMVGMLEMMPYILQQSRSSESIESDRVMPNILISDKSKDVVETPQNFAKQDFRFDKEFSSQINLHSEIQKQSAIITDNNMLPKIQEAFAGTKQVQVLGEDQSRNWRSDEVHRPSIFSRNSTLMNLTDPSFKMDETLKGNRNKRAQAQSCLNLINSPRNSSASLNRPMLKGNVQGIYRFGSGQNKKRGLSQASLTGYKAINDKNESKQHISDLLSVRTSNSNSGATISSRIRKSQLFVFKIIHDLRHPTESVVSGISELVIELSTEYFKKDPNLVISDQTRFKYTSHSRVKRALERVQKEIQKGQSDIMSHPSPISSSLIISSGPKQFNNTNSIVPDKGEMSSNNSGLCSPIKENDWVNRLGWVKKPSTERVITGKPLSLPSPKEFSQNIKSLQDAFWSIDIKKVEADSRQREEIVEIEEAKVPAFGMNSSISNSDIVLQDSADESAGSVCSESHVSIDKISDNFVSKAPKSKKFSRESVQDLVQRKISENNGKQDPYRFSSLAVDRLIYSSDVARQLNVEQGIEECNKIKRSKSQLGNVHKVIDQFKAKSAALSMESQSNKSDVPSDLKIFSSGGLSQMPNRVIVPIRSFPNENKQVENKKNRLLSENSGEPGIENMIDRRQLRVNRSVRAIDYASSQQLPIVHSRDQQNNQEGKSVPTSVQLSPKLQMSIQVLLAEREYLTQMVNRLLHLTSKSRKQLENMKGSTMMMKSLLNDLMNQAQLANNTFQMVNEHFDCIKLIKSCIQTLSLQAKLKGVTLKGPILSKPIEKYYFLSMYSDERRYCQFILNFLTNSIKFTPAGGEVTVILNVININYNSSEGSLKPIQESKHSQSNYSMSSTPDKGMGEESKDEQVNNSSQFAQQKPEGTITFQMIFRDTGCGISKENQKKVFHNFQKLQEGAESNKLGVGLGLSICKEIILAQGGKVDIKSEEGKGSDFIIYLKAKCIIDTERIARAQHRQENGEEPDTPSTKSSCIVDEESEEHCSSSSLTYEKNAEVTCQDESIGKQSSVVLSYRKRSQSANDINKGNLMETIKEQQSSCLVSDASVEDTIKRPITIAAFVERSLFTIYEQSQENMNNSCNQPSRCLLANDNTFLLLAFQQTLKNHFDFVDTVENGKDAVDMVKKQVQTYYNAIILDINMPKMGGSEACQKIRDFLEKEEESKEHIRSRSALSSNRSPSAKSSVRKSEGSNTLLDNQKSGRSVSNFSKSQIKRPVPFVYALTSEANGPVLDAIREVGFKAIFSMLNTISVKQILENAGLEYRQVDEFNEVVIFNPEQYNGILNDAEQGIISDSDSDKGQKNPPENISADSVAQENNSVQAASDLLSFDQDKAPI